MGVEGGITISHCNKLASYKMFHRALDWDGFFGTTSGKMDTRFENWNYCGSDRDKWRAHVNTVMEFQVPLLWVILSLAEKLLPSLEGLFHRARQCGHFSDHLSDEEQK